MRISKFIYIILFLAVLPAWYLLPVWWGGYSGFRVYKVVEFITETFPRAVIAVQAREGADLSKVKKDLKETIVERGILPVTIYAEAWKVNFDSKNVETKLIYPLSPNSTPHFEAVRAEVLAKLKKIKQTHDFLHTFLWDGGHIIVTYRTL